MFPNVTSSSPTSHAAPAEMQSIQDTNQQKFVPSASSASTSSSAGHKRKASTSPLQSRWKQCKAEEARIKLTQSTYAKLNLHKQLHAPIKKLTHDEAISAMAELAADIAHWERATVPSHPLDDDIDYSDWQQPPRTKQKRWNDRLDDAQFIIDTASSGVAIFDFIFDSGKNDSGKSNCFSYYIDNKPVGMVILEGGSDPYISAFVTHPGSEGAGGALMEYAVNFIADQAPKESENVQIKLTPLKDAIGAYRQLGFIQEEDQMILNSDTLEFKEKWCKQDGKWRLAKHVDKKYIA